MTNDMKFSKILFLACAVGILSVGFYAVSANAQDVMSGLKTAAGTAGLPGKPTGGFEAAIGGIIGSVMGLIGAILFVYMLYGGFKWMTAGGDNKAVTEAQAIIRNAIIGIAIIVFAYVIADYVITTLTTATAGSGAPVTTQSNSTCGGMGSGGSGYGNYFCQSNAPPTAKCAGQLNCDAGQSCCANPS